MDLYPLNPAFRSLTFEPTEALNARWGTVLTFLPRKIPFQVLTNLLFKPPTAAVILAALLILSFIPISAGKNVTQIALMLLCIPCAATMLLHLRADTAGLLGVIGGVAVCQLIGVIHSPVEDKVVAVPITLAILLLIGPITLTLSRRIRIAKEGEYVRNLSVSLVCFFCVELVTRFLFSPSIGERSLLESPTDITSLYRYHDSFYKYKFSVFYFDSNFVALALICLLALLIVFRKCTGTVAIVVAYICLAATLSRASIAAGVCQLVFWLFWRWRKYLLATAIIVLPVLFYLSLAWYLTQGGGAVKGIDGSLFTKFFILVNMADAYNKADITQRLFGIGAGNTSHLIGIAAHSLIATFVLEFGLIGSALIIVYVWLLCRKSPTALYLLVVPIIVNGFSVVATSMPYFFVTLGILGSMRKLRHGSLSE